MESARGGPGYEEIQAALQTEQRLPPPTRGASCSAPGMLRVRILAPRRTNPPPPPQSHPEVELVLFVDGMLDPANLGPPLARSRRPQRPS